MLKSTCHTVRIRIHPSTSKPKLRIKTESMEKSHVMLKSRDYCQKIIDLGHKLKETSKRYESQINQNMPPQMVCPLQLFSLIHEGSYSKVHKVRNTANGCHYVLKKIEIDSSRQNREEKILKELKSTFLAEVVDIYWGNKLQKKKELNILMKLYRYDLKDLLATRSKFDLLDIKIMLYQMVRSIHYVHSKRICHRDVRPSNFLFDEKGRLYLSDFGSAKHLKKDEKNICQIGAIGYRAPELLLGYQKYTNAIDVWSLGCILLEILTGKQVFNGSSNIDSLLNIVRYLGSKQLKNIKGQKQILSLVPSLKGIGLQTLDSSWDSELNDLINIMLKLDPNKRMKTIDILSHSFFDDLRQQQTYLSIMKEKFDISDFFHFSSVQLHHSEQYYTKLIPIWHRDRPQKRTSNVH